MVAPRFVASKHWLALHATLCLTWIFSVISASDADARGEKQIALMSELDAVMSESDARTLLEPYMGELKKLDARIVEKVIFKHWWSIAEEIVAKSHLQKVDFSFNVRKAVKALKDQADELVRTLNPKYGHAQQVAPAFQWAQNDTCVFLLVKFTVRWNAPGALEVAEPAVNMHGNTFNFTGIGKHSNNKYKYQLALSLFDYIVPSESTWNTASVGKLSVTLRKRWPRKWVRLLASKTNKIGNMHVWMETQDKMNGHMGGMSSVSHSPVTCAAVQKLYCSVTDTCKPSGDCSQCPGKTQAVDGEHICGGVPTQKPGLAFQDVDKDEQELGGSIKITKASHDFETDQYAVYWGKDSSSKLELPEGQSSLVGVTVPHASNPEIHLEFNTKAPEKATHLLAYSTNAFGEHATPGSVELKDAYLPKDKPEGISFEDEDGDKGEVKGDVHIRHAIDTATLDKYTLYWGKSATKKIDKPKPYIGSVEKSKHSYFISDSTQIPPGATHLLLYSQNSHGEHSTPAAVEIVDSLKACVKKGNDDCPTAVSLTAAPDGSGAKVMSITRARAEAGLSGYVLYWGRNSCEEGKGDAIKNGHIKQLPIGEPAEYQYPAEAEVPDGTTHVLAFSQNRWGESDFCVSQSFATDSPKAEL